MTKMKLLPVFSLVILVLGIKILFDLSKEVIYRQESRTTKNDNRPNPTEGETEVHKFIAQPFITGFDFELRLVALLSSFVALSLCQCSPKSINQTIFRRILLLACLVPVLTLSFILYRDYYVPVDHINERRKAQTKEIAFELLEPQSFKLTCCIGLDRILQNDRNESTLLNEAYFDKLENHLLYQNKTFAQLERETDRTIAEAIQDIYLKFLNKRHEVHWTLSPRVLFLPYRDSFHRCFEVVVRPKEPVYQSRLSATRLVLNLKARRWLVSVEPVNVSSNAENSDFEGDTSRKVYRTLERKLSAEANCSDYAALYPNCDSKQNCFEVCVNQQLLEFGKIADYFMIYKDQLSEREWSTIQIRDKTHPYSLPKKIRSFCEEKFSKDDCSWTVHERIKRTDHQPFIEGEIVLPYNLRKEFEEKTAPSGLPLDLLTMQGVFLALNLLRLASVVCLLKFEVRKIELLHRLIYALCLIALLAYVVHTFWTAMNEKLTYQQYFESPKTIQMPDAVMCFERLNVTEYDSSEKKKNIDSSEEVEENVKIANHTETVNDVEKDVENELNSTSSYTEPFSWKDDYELSMNYEDGELTGSRLEELNADLTPEKIFDKIVYLHQTSNEWITLNSTNNFTNDDLSVGHFFLRGNKCFSVNNHLDYDGDRFTLLQDQKIDVLQVLFKESFKMELNNDPRNLIFSFATKKRSKSEFNKMFDDLYLGVDASFVINQRSLVKMTVKNHFAWLNPFALLTETRDELDGYFSKLKSAFTERYNLTTLSLPLEVGDPDQTFSFLKISNESLFQQFYEEYVEKNGPPIDSEREFAMNELETHFRRFEGKHLDYDLKVSLTFAKQIIEQSNAAAYLQLVLHLANVLIILIVFALFDRCICKLSK